MFINSTALDVSSFISAQEFVQAQNERRRPTDPFARQCFAEVTQSLIFQPRVVVPHPVVFVPAPDDFGAEPLLLRELMEAGVVEPIAFEPAEVEEVRRLESVLTEALEQNGPAALEAFARATLECDQAALHQGEAEPLGRKMAEWNSFQEANVRSVPGHHSARITGGDGIEDDEIGAWIRRTVARGSDQLSVLTGGIDPGYFIATLVRGLRYGTRADAVGAIYQPHPVRRDFGIAMEVEQNDDHQTAVGAVLRAIRGIQESLDSTATGVRKQRIRLLELELPLLGGRLWRDDELGTFDRHSMVNLTVERLSAYREKAHDVRSVISRCVQDEDYLRLQRDMEQVQADLLGRLGLTHVKLTSTERELVKGANAVVERATGIPIVSAAWLALRSVANRVHYRGRPYQRFVYREFVRAWKRAGS